jgi:serine/threonine-protein kinase
VPGYEILEELGRGGMGVVYKARQVKLNRVVALKMILTAGHASAADLQRFRDEAEAIAQLRHPHIVQVYSVGEQGGRPFFALEFVEGGTLAQKLESKPQPPTAAARMVELLARGVHAAHQAGIIHRDLKPANVLLGEYGETVVIDWGLAKAVDGRAQQGVARDLDAARADATVAGYALGTPMYMPLEQARGEPIDMRADVYALGAMLYHLFAGTPAYEGTSSREVLAQLLAGPPMRLGVRVPALAPDLAAIVDKAMEREPSRRYPSAEQMAADLSASPPAGSCRRIPTR